MIPMTAIIEASISVGYFALAFIIYFFSTGYQSIHRLAIRWGDSEGTPQKRIYIERLLGFTLFGVIPGLFFLIASGNPLSEYGFALPSGKNLWLWWLIPIILFLAFNFARPKKSVDIVFYPQVKRETWDKKSLLVNAISWTIYNTGYEFAFRGWLFFTCLHAFGFFPAVMINSAIYGITHIPKGKNEAYGAFFMGILFCLIARETGSFIIPMVLHVILAVGNDLKAIKVNPETRFV